MRISLWSIVALSLALMFSLNVRAESEAYYRDSLCKGVTEYRNSDGTRTDCEMPGLSIEYDFASKWYECVSQAGHYAILNKTEAECQLIVEYESERIRIPRAYEYIRYYRLPIGLRIVGPAARPDEYYHIDMNKPLMQ